MKKIIALLLIAAMLFTLTACGSEPASSSPALEPGSDQTTSTPETPEDSEQDYSQLAGTYKYYEDKGSMGIMPWTIELGEDGSCVLTEHNSYIGDQVKVCDGWTDNGDGTFTSGAWESVDGPAPDFIDEVGRITWEIVGDGICQPVNGPASVDPELASEGEEESSEDSEEEAETETIVVVTPENYIPDPAVAVIATDRHENAEILPQLLSVIYTEGYCPGLVAHGGDAVGSGPNLESNTNYAPIVDTSVIRGEIDVALSPEVQLLVLLASHDANMTDSVGSLYGECVGIECGDYYVFTLPEEFMDTEAAALVGSALFVDWAQSGEVDPSKPIIILSHKPMHYLRKDNLGAAIWHEAINQVATAGGEQAVRNVIFFHGHNHTADSTEYYYEPGTSLAIHGLGEDGQSEDIICYTYITAGYLNENGSCTLLKVEESSIRVLKCSLEGITELGVLERLG